MPNIDFYATGDDLRALLCFMYEHTDIVAFDAYSPFDREARFFASVQQIEAAHMLGKHPSCHLQIWSPSVMKRPRLRRVELKVPGHHFRYAVEGAGLMQLYLDGVKHGVIHHTHFGCWSETGARRGSIHAADKCDWRALSRISGQIQRYIRHQLAPGSLHGRPILRHAFDLAKRGARLAFGRETFSASSGEIREEGAPAPRWLETPSV